MAWVLGVEESSTVVFALACWQRGRLCLRLVLVCFTITGVCYVLTHPHACMQRRRQGRREGRISQGDLGVRPGLRIELPSLHTFPQVLQNFRLIAHGLFGKEPVILPGPTIGRDYAVDLYFTYTLPCMWIGSTTYGSCCDFLLRIQSYRFTPFFPSMIGLFVVSASCFAWLVPVSVARRGGE